MGKRLTTEEFVARAIKVHGDDYGYGEVVYTDSRDSVTLYCKYGKHWFTQQAVSHMRGFGCLKCKNVKTGDLLRKSQEQFIKEAVATHGGLYKYDRAIYLSAEAQVEIFCKKCNNYFLQGAKAHTRGHGCKRCGSKHLDSWMHPECEMEPTVLYYLKLLLPEGPVYKIGITLERRGVEKRFSSMAKIPYVLITTQVFRNRYIALLFEQHILRQHHKHQYKGPDILKGGNSELFTRDVLNLDGRA